MTFNFEVHEHNEHAVIIAGDARIVIEVDGGILYAHCETTIADFHGNPQTAHVKLDIVDGDVGYIEGYPPIRRAVNV